LGVVTGITLEFQFGTNWSRYSAYVGDIFGSLLAIEATVAFFLESTLIGIWVFGWKKISKKAHAAVMWLIAAAGTMSGIWILIANGWMQHPVGYAIRNGLLKKQHIEFFTRSFRIALVFGLIFSIAVAVEGDMHGVHVAEVQPAKLAAMEAHWETTTRKSAPSPAFSAFSVITTLMPR